MCCETGTDEKNIAPIVENVSHLLVLLDTSPNTRAQNFKEPGKDKSFSHATDSGWYGRGIYFSEWPVYAVTKDDPFTLHFLLLQRYSMDYIKGGTKLLLCQVLTGRVYH